MQLVLNHTGLHMGIRNRCFFITNGTETRMISPERVTSILITSAIQITTPALMLAVQKNIPVVITDVKTGLYATLRSAAYCNLPAYRRWQLQFCQLPQALQWMAGLLLIKMEHQMSNMRHWQLTKQLPDPLSEAILEKAESKLGELKLSWAGNSLIKKEELTNGEAIFAGYYWRLVALATPPQYNVMPRHHRPARDRLNASLNYWYGMLYHQVETAIHTAGLDGSCSMLHAEDYNTPALCYDLIEPFRPQADRAVVAMCQNLLLLQNHFIDKGSGLWLSKEGKQLIIPAFHAWMHEKIDFNGRNTLRKNHILQLPANLLKRIREIFDKSE